MTKNPNNNVKCSECEKDFYRRGNRKFACRFVTCSKECKNKYQGKIKYPPRPRPGKVTICKVCKTEKYFPPSYERKYCSSECYFNDGDSNRPKGVKHYAYTGKAKYRRSLDHRLRRWSRLLRKRDGRICRKCGERNGVMCADHILPWADFPELRYELRNGQIICQSCHNIKTGIENKNRDRKKKLSETYREKILNEYKTNILV